MSEKPVAPIKTFARYEPDTVYIGTGEYVAECVRADDGDYYLAADVDAAIEALLEELDAMEAENEWLLAERDALTAEVERLREALRGWIWARENGASEGLAVQYAIAMLGDIHQIADAAMSKENRND